MQQSGHLFKGSNQQLSSNNAPILVAFAPVALLILLLFLSYRYFGDSSSYGPNQIAMFVAAALALILKGVSKKNWEEVEKHIVDSISVSLGALLILLLIGALIGAFLLSGTVPTLIYYGLNLISPDWFYPATSLICALVSISIGSSWTTAATVGVALMGVSAGLGADPAVTAGAVISGAYFGDKMSPLSETTNLAPACVGAGLFAHIKAMLWTTIPAFLFALILFALMTPVSDSETALTNISLIQGALLEHFDLSLISLAPLIVVFLLAIKGVPALPAIFLGTALACVWSYVFQGELIAKLVTDSDAPYSDPLSLLWHTLYAGVTIETGQAQVSALLSGGGMSDMLNSVWLVMSAMSFGAVMEKTGFLQSILKQLLKLVTSARSLIVASICTCFTTNLITGDQYMAIVMPGRMYKAEFERKNLSMLSLSRSLEDGGTITSPLIPWNACGAFMFGVLLVHPFDYAPYAFFNYLCPLFAIVLAFFGFRITKMPAMSEMRFDEVLTEKR